ncbi:MULTISPECIES: hypothetical protein [Terrabacteria group]|uniref:hypothetical protein n=1 Tax=Bacillati TaxID=1783272 RepID=UPI001C6DE957|nr:MULTISPECIES: hypothetical protein [Terrabacteria group]MBW9212241.1 hypothetical protein [Trueperella sp. zg.1013]
MKSHVIAVANLDSRRLIEKRFYAKPKFVLYMVLFLSLALFAVNVVWGLMGLVIAAYCLICLFQFPDIPLLEVTKDYLVLYQKREEVFLLYWDELYRWSYEKDWEQDRIRFVLCDDSIQVIPFYNKKRIQVYMDRYALKKEGKA